MVIVAGASSLLTGGERLPHTAVYSPRFIIPLVVFCSVLFCSCIFSSPFPADRQFFTYPFQLTITNFHRPRNKLSALVRQKWQKQTTSTAPRPLILTLTGGRDTFRRETARHKQDSPLKCLSKTGPALKIHNYKLAA